jgi:ABC-type sulfate transport system permease subunit
VPLQVEILYNEYEFVAAFSVATLLTLLAILTLTLKQGVELWARSSEEATFLRELARGRVTTTQPSGPLPEPGR